MTWSGPSTPWTPTRPASTGWKASNLVYRKLLSTLEGQGLTVIATVGERFDPTMHEAVMQAEGEEGVVVGALQKGYRFHERVVRPAMVQVGAGAASKDA